MSTTTRIPAAVRLLLILPLAAAALTGCTRTLVQVEGSGDRAYERGEYGTALSEYSEYAERVGIHARIQYKIGRTQLAMGQPGVAVEHLWRAHELAPLEDEYVETLAQALAADNQRDELYRMLRLQIDTEPSPENYLRLGRYAAKIGDADEARTALLTAAELDKGTTVGPQLALADFYKSLGDRSEELRRLRMALHIDPQNSTVQERIRTLGEVPGPSYTLVPEEAY